MDLIPLSPIDHVFIGDSAYPINFLFVFDGTLDFTNLEKSLRKAILKFQPVSSKLQKTDDQSYAFKLGPEGCTFIKTQQDSEPDPNQIPSLYPFLDSVDTVEGEPLTRIKLTHTPTQSLLGVSISHALVDGYSYFSFLSAWAKETRDEIYPLPDHRRHLLQPTKKRSETPIDAIALSQSGGFSYSEKIRIRVPPEKLKWEWLHLPKAELDALSREAKSTAEMRLTQNDLITAFLWKKYGPLWAPSREASCSLVCAYDYRRLHPEVSRLYFGNAVVESLLKLKSEELARIPLGKLATLIHESVKAVDLQTVNASLESLAQLRAERGLISMEHIHVSDPESGFLVTNLSRMPVDELDFGKGPPSQFRILTPTPRTAIVLPDSDGVLIQICGPIAA